MLFNSALITSFLLASAVMAHRRHEHRRSHFSDHLGQLNDAAAASGEDHYNDQFAGARLVDSEGTFNFAAATFTAPDIKSKGGAAFAYVTMGALCDSGAIGAGILFGMEGSQPGYLGVSAFGDQNTTLSVSIIPGDDIRLSVTQISPTSGRARIRNLRTHQQDHHDFEDSTYKLCGKDVEFAVAVYGNVPLPDFGTVTFRDIKATGPSGDHTVDGATIADFEQGNTKLTYTHAEGNSVTIKYL